MKGFVSPRRVQQLTFKVWSGPITTNFITKAESSKKKETWAKSLHFLPVQSTSLREP